MFSVLSDDFDVDISSIFPSKFKLAEWSNPLNHNLVSFQTILVQANTDEPLVSQEIEVESEIKNNSEFYVTFLPIGYADMEEGNRLALDSILAKKWEYSVTIKLQFRGEEVKEEFMTFTATFNTDRYSISQKYEREIFKRKKEDVAEVEVPAPFLEAVSIDENGRESL